MTGSLKTRLLRGLTAAAFVSAGIAAGLGGLAGTAYAQESATTTPARAANPGQVCVLILLPSDLLRTSVVVAGAVALARRRARGYCVAALTTGSAKGSSRKDSHPAVGAPRKFVCNTFQRD